MLYPVELSLEEWQELDKRQRDLELEARSAGMERFQNRVRKANEADQSATVGGAKSLLVAGLESLTQAIDEALCVPRQGSAGRRHLAARFIKRPTKRKRGDLITSVEPKVAAYLTLKGVLDSLHGRHRLPRVALKVAGLLLDEIQYRRFQQAEPRLVQHKLKQFRTSNYAHMTRSMRASMRIAGVNADDLDLSVRDRMLLGIKLIDLLITATGLFHVDKVRARKGRGIKEQHTLRAADETLAWVQARNEALEVMRPIHLPMLLPPARWGKHQRGGYRYELAQHRSLVRHANTYGRKEHRQVEEAADMPIVYRALNTLQETSWKINPRVLWLVEQIMEQGGGIAGLPSTTDVPMPAKPCDIATNEEARKRWRQQAHMVKNENHQQRQALFVANQLVMTATSFAEEKMIFFPFSLDFRGRIYPMADSLSPQGPDLSRALLLFAGLKPTDEQGLRYQSTARPVDEAGARFLAIHGANCMGDTPEGAKVSKLTLDERFEWAVQTTPRILATADAPLDDLWWAQADKPLQFYAFCVEWANLVRANERGEEYVCLLPVAMDGTCNGLQHFAALFRDEAGGRAVNLVPQATPQDIYHRIAENVLDQLTKSNDPLASLWLGLHDRFGIITRKLTKRPTMTFGYGAKRFGFAEQIKSFLQEQDDWKGILQHCRLDDGKLAVSSAARYMSGLIWQALQGSVVSAFDGMAWMQAVARGVASHKLSISWRVPGTGFPVSQGYRKLAKRRIKTVLQGQTYMPALRERTDEADVRKQTNGIAPNIIHSLDAAVLMQTVVAAEAEGVGQFSMIHDSYGTTPADCAVLARVLRQQFAKFYREHDVVADLYSQFAAQWEKPEECPWPPAKGTLDVSHVQASDYFFC